MEKTADYSIADRLESTKIWTAYDHIEGLHNKTPLIPYGIIHQDGFKVNLWAKMDTLNPGGSFKDRGAEFFVYEAMRLGILHPGDTVVTASAGNHAKGVAKAAKEHGLSAVIYMSDQTPEKKIQGTKELGGEVNLVEGDYHHAAKAAKEFADERKLVYVPAYEHEDIILGQSTVSTEIMMRANELLFRPDFIVAPYGGGGLANGIGFATRYFDRFGLFNQDGKPTRIRIYAVQAENFNTAVRSFKEGRMVDYVHNS